VSGGTAGGVIGGMIGSLVCECEEMKPLPRTDPGPARVDCQAVRELCIAKCTEETWPSGTLDGAPFFRCLRECLESFECQRGGAYMNKNQAEKIATALLACAGKPDESLGILRHDMDEEGYLSYPKGDR